VIDDPTLQALVLFGLARALARPGTPEHEAAAALELAMAARVSASDPGVPATHDATELTPRND